MRRASLLDPNASTLNMSPYSARSSSKSSTSNSQAAKDGQQGTGSTARLPPRGLFAQMHKNYAATTAPQNQARDDDLTMDDMEDDLDQDTLIDRLRLARNDAMQQHLYATAEFWGNKAFELTFDPNDGFWLAQIYFLTLQFARAERVLTAAKPDLSLQSALALTRSNLGPSNGLVNDSIMTDVQASPNLHETPASHHNTRAKGKGKAKANTPHVHSSSVMNGALDQQADANAATNTVTLIRLIDVSIACRYLAAQCLVRQQKWSEALDLLGTSNPFASTSSATQNGPLVKSQDGGIKFEASLCHLRGVIHLYYNAVQKAKESFLEALSIDVKCFEAFSSLVDGNLMTIDEEWQFVQGLKYKEQLSEEDAGFVRMAYTVRLKKYKHHDEFAACRERLMKEYGLSRDPDVLYGLADELFLSLKWQDCFAVTSEILSYHPGHAPTLPLHLGCMYHLPPMHSRLFLLSHDLVEKSPEMAVAWYAVGLWYFTQKRWDEARRFFGKSVLIDSRFGPAWIAFAHAYALEGEHDQAVTAYSTAQRHFQGTHLPLLFIGMQHIQLNNHKLAHQYLTTALEMCSLEPLLANELGVMYYWLENYDKAVEYLTQCLELVEKGQGSQSAWYATHVNLGHAYRKLRKWKQATASFENALSLNSTPAAAHLGLGIVLTATGRRDEAVERLHEALIRTPADPVAAQIMTICLDSRLDNLKKAMTQGEDFTFPGLAANIATELDNDVIANERQFLDRANGIVSATGQEGQDSIEEGDSSMLVDQTTTTNGNGDNVDLTQDMDAD